MSGCYFLVALGFLGKQGMHQHQEPNEPATGFSAELLPTVYMHRLNRFPVLLPE